MSDIVPEFKKYLDKKYPEIAEIAKFAETIKHCGDYGQVFWHGEKKQIHWTGGDGDGDPEEGEDYTDGDDIRKGFLAIEAVKTVELVAEQYPERDDGWFQVHPVIQGW